MRRVLVAALTAAALSLPQPAVAQATLGDIIVALEEDGYRVERVSRTFLGRTRITATDGRRQREIVFNPRTGEILRDLTEGPPAPPTGEGQAGGSGGAIAGGGDDDDDDDVPDDDRDDDDRDDDDRDDGDREDRDDADDGDSDDGDSDGGDSDGGDSDGGDSDGGDSDGGDSDGGDGDGD